MATSLRELIVSVSADTRKYQTEMERASRMGANYFRSVQQGGSAATRSWNEQTSAARTHATAIEASSQAISRYAAVAASAFGASRLISMADDYGQISSRIRLATQSTAEFEMAQSRLVEIANRTYREYSEAADQFAATAVSMREMGFAANDTLDAAEALGLALVAGGSNAQRGAAANDAWAKSMVQGRIATEQFQTLLLQTPRVVQALGEGLGKTTQELQQMAKDGQLTARVVVPAITSQIAKLSAEVESMPTTVQDAGIRFRNELQRWVGEANEASGATQVLVRGIELLAGNIDALATIGGAAAVGALAGKMLLLGKAAASAAVSMTQTVLSARVEALAIRDATAAGLAKAQADVRRAQAAMTATRGTAASATATRNYANALLVERQAALAAAQAQTAYARAMNLSATAGRAALGLLGGPAGLAITLGVLASGWVLFRDKTDDASQSLIDFSGAADTAIAKFRELNKAQQAGAILRLSEELEEASRSMADTISLLGREADFTDLYASFADGLQRLQGEFNSGKLKADDFANAVSQMADDLAATGQIEEVQRRGLIKYAEQVGTTAREIERKSGILDTFNGINRQAEQQAGNTAGALRGQAGAFTELGEEAQKALQKMQQRADSVRGQIERIGKSARQVAHLDIRDEFRRMQRAGEVDFRDLSNPEVQRFIQAGREVINNVAEHDAAQKQLAASTRASAVAAKAANKEQSDAVRLAEELEKRYEDLAAAQTREIALHGDSSRAAAVAYDIKSGALKGYTGDLKETIQEQAKWLDWLDEMAALDDVWADIEREHGKYAEIFKQKGDEMSTYAEQAARNMQSHFADFLFDPFEDGVSGMVKGFSDAIRRMLAEALSAKLFELIGSAMSGYSGQGTWGNVVRGIGGAIQTGGGRAGGGRVEAFKSYDITEHGQPEVLSYGGRQVLLMGAQGGMVSPLMNRSGGGAGSDSKLTRTLDMLENKISGSGNLGREQKLVVVAVYSEEEGRRRMKEYMRSDDGVRVQMVNFQQNRKQAGF